MKRIPHFEAGLSVSCVDEVLEGLLTSEKSLPSKLFYDKRGSELFDAICGLDEYYQTRTELGILRDNIDEIVGVLGPRVQLVEYGSGSGLKTRILLSSLPSLAAYLPIDISRQYLEEVVDRLREQFPRLSILPICVDYTMPFELPRTVSASPERRVFFFPGSTIGNLEQAEAISLLKRTRSLAGKHGALLIGIDLQKSKTVLEAAYNDAQGFTEQFNKNLLRRLNRDMGANFQLTDFEHYAFYNEACGRIEMHLVSRRPQTVVVAGYEIFFREGETIHTENSHKYTIQSFSNLASEAGFIPEQVWTDGAKKFAVFYLA